MRKKVMVGLVGDYNSSAPAHQAIPLALQRAWTGSSGRTVDGMPAMSARIYLKITNLVGFCHFYV